METHRAPSIVEPLAWGAGPCVSQSLQAHPPSGSDDRAMARNRPGIDPDRADVAFTSSSWRGQRPLAACRCRVLDQPARRAVTGSGSVVDPSVDARAGSTRCRPNASTPRERTQMRRHTHPVGQFAIPTSREVTASQGNWYDVAVSFASEQRDYVESTVLAAQALGLHVFYDRQLRYDWWGQNFIIEQRLVYSRLAFRFVPFISAEYLANPYPRDEYLYAMLRSVEVGAEYILPVLMGEVRVPAELLHPYVGSLRAEEHTPRQLA